MIPCFVYADEGETKIEIEVYEDEDDSRSFDDVEQVYEDDYSKQSDKVSLAAKSSPGDNTSAIIPVSPDNYFSVQSSVKQYLYKLEFQYDGSDSNVVSYWLITNSPDLVLGYQNTLGDPTRIVFYNNYNASGKSQLFYLYQNRQDAIDNSYNAVPAPYSNSICSDPSSNYDKKNTGCVVNSSSTGNRGFFILQSPSGTIDTQDPSVFGGDLYNMSYNAGTGTISWYGARPYYANAELFYFGPIGNYVIDYEMVQTVALILIMCFVLWLILRRGITL